jgi:ribosomal protein S27AE
MAAPVIKKKAVVLTSSDACPRCGHLLSAHFEEKARQCGSCACVAQDVA